MYVLAFLLSSHQDEGCRSVRAEQSQDRLNEWQWATPEETWIVLTKWETSDEGKIGAFQYLKGHHENETELFFVTLGLGSGKTRAHHFVLALEQTAFGGSELSTTAEISQTAWRALCKTGKKLMVWVGRLSKIKLWPMGQIYATTCFCIACEIWIIFCMFKWSLKIKRRVKFCDGWKWYEVQISMSIQKIAPEHSQAYWFAYWFAYCSMVALSLQSQLQQRLNGSQKSKIFIIWSFREKVCQKVWDHPIAFFFPSGRFCEGEKFLP